MPVDYFVIYQVVNYKFEKTESCFIKYTPLHHSGKCRCLPKRAQEPFVILPHLVLCQYISIAYLVLLFTHILECFMKVASFFSKMNFRFFTLWRNMNEVLIVLLGGIPELHNKEQQKVFGEWQAYYFSSLLILDVAT